MRTLLRHRFSSLESGFPMNRFSRFLVFFLTLGSLYWLGGCQKERSLPRKESAIRIAGHTMGTTYQVRLNQLPVSLSVEELRDHIQSKFQLLNDQMSNWQSDSEIVRFNTFPTTDWFPISQEFLTVLQTAKQLYEETEGTFDPTISPLVELWNFGTQKTEAIFPTDAERLAALSRLGFHEIELRGKPPAIRKQRPQIALNLSAIAKGFGVDQIADMLDEFEVNDYLIEVGGEMRLKGTKPDGSLWRVGINKPDGELHDIERTLFLSNMGMATSGDYRNYFLHEGKRYSHIIDPRTGFPTQHRLASVTVLAESCMKADAYATALMVLGEEEGLQFAEQHSLPVFMLIRSESGFQERSSTAFETVLANQSDAKTEPDSTERNSSGSFPFHQLVAAFAVIAIAMVSMALGIIFSNKKLQGSCGGVGSTKTSDGKSACEFCANSSSDCQEAAEMSSESKAS